MCGQQRKLLVVVEDRGAGLRAVVGEAKSLCDLFVETGFAQQVGVFGAD